MSSAIVSSLEKILLIEEVTHCLYTCLLCEWLVANGLLCLLMLGGKTYTHGSPFLLFLMSWL